MSQTGEKRHFQVVAGLLAYLLIDRQPDKTWKTWQLASNLAYLTYDELQQLANSIDHGSWPKLE